MNRAGQIPRLLRCAVAAAALVVIAAGCATVPVTGRRQLSLIPSSEILSMSDQEYRKFLGDNPPSTDAAAAARVQSVGQKIQGAVESYMAANGMSDQLAGYRWEFHLVESKDVNAWCMPGGRVVVYSGILPVAQDNTGLAVVMGHEIAHAVAEHGNERMSQALVLNLGGVALSEALRSKPEQTRQLWLGAFGLGAQVGALLPYSRLHESEADRLGLIFMAMAGYDPQEAVGLWQRMEARSEGAAPPEFLSTHPSDETRIKKIRKAMPEAMRYYKP